MTGQIWNPDTYRTNASFVPRYGRPVVNLLDPRSDETILDLGCGDGTLSLEIAACGATVVGVDHSRAMVESARRNGLVAHVQDARALDLDTVFDAVFSNAVLHWISPPEDIVGGVAGVLRPGGRFVGEFGGHGNIAAIVTAIAAVLDRYGISFDAVTPWYYPTPDEYAKVLTTAGFEVESIALIPRPTPLPTGIGGWLDTFAGAFYNHVPVEDRSRARNHTIALLRNSLCDRTGNWMADYVRLRFLARLPG